MLSGEKKIWEQIEPHLIALEEEDKAMKVLLLSNIIDGFDYGDCCLKKSIRYIAIGTIGMTCENSQAPSNDNGQQIKAPSEMYFAQAYKCLTDGIDKLVGLSEKAAYLYYCRAIFFNQKKYSSALADCFNVLINSENFFSPKPMVGFGKSPTEATARFIAGFKIIGEMRNMIIDLLNKIKEEKIKLDLGALHEFPKQKLLEQIKLFKDHKDYKFILECCLDKNNVLGSRLWKQEGFFECKLNSGVLKEINELAQNVNKTEDKKNHSSKDDSQSNSGNSSIQSSTQEKIDDNNSSRVTISYNSNYNIFNPENSSKKNKYSSDDDNDINNDNDNDNDNFFSL